MKMNVRSIFLLPFILLLLTTFTWVPHKVGYSECGLSLAIQSHQHDRSIRIPPSSLVNLIRTGSLPPAPVGVTASAGEFSDKIRVSWGSLTQGHQVFLPLLFSSVSNPAPSPNTLYFQVHRSPTPAIKDATQLTGNHPASPFDDTTAEPGVTYYYWVKACNSTGCSGYSSPASGWRAETMPAPPTGLSASQGGSNENVHLSWTASANARYYMIYRNTTNSHEDQSVISEKITTCSFEDHSAAPGVRHYYWVTACNSAGCSDYSSPASGWCGEIPPPPPVNVSASQGTFSDRIVLSWSTSVGASFYQVYRNTIENLDHVEQLPEEPASSPFYDATAEAATVYYYWVKACNLAGCSNYSAPASGWLTTTPPIAPTGLSASQGDYTDKIHLSWTGSENTQYYRIFRNTSDDHEGQVVLEYSHPSCTFDDLNAKPGVTYHYWVKACNATDCSEYSAPASGWRAETLPTPPIGVTASDGSYTDKVLLSWTASEGETYFKLYRNTFGSPSEESTLTPNHPASPYEDTSAEPEILYYYWVKACNSAGCSSYSDPDTGWRALVNIANGDFEAGNDGSWSVYSKRSRNLIIHDDFTDIPAHSGHYLAWLGGANEETSHISQSVQVLPSHPYLHFWYQIQSQDTCDYDYARVRINGYTYMSFDLCSRDNTEGWTPAVLNLSFFGGSTVTLQFDVTTDLTFISSFYLDDITLSSISTAAMSPNQVKIE